IDPGDLGGIEGSDEDDLFGTDDAAMDGPGESEEFGDVSGADVDGLDEPPYEGVADSDFDIGDLGIPGESGDDDSLGVDDAAIAEAGGSEEFGDLSEGDSDGIDESSREERADADFDLDAFGDSSDSAEDLGGVGMFDGDESSLEDGAAFGDLDGLEEFGDLSEGDAVGPDDSSSGELSDSDFDLGAFDGTEESAGDDISGTGDAALAGLGGPEEFGEIDEALGAELSDSEFDSGGFDDVLGDAGADGPSEDDAAFEDLDDVDDSLSDSFGSDFGSQMDEDFGDIELDEDASADTDAAFSGSDDIDFSPDGDSLDDLDALDEDGFSLGDFGEEFDIREDSIDEFAGLDFQTDGIEEEGAEEGALHGPVGELDRELSDEEFIRLRKTLSSLPLNVKIAAEECIGEGKGSAESLNELIDLLIGGASPVKIAEHVSKTIGKKLEVPRGYQKRSGLAFEEQQQTFVYRLQHVILPMLRTALLVGLATAVVGLLGHRFVYRPIHAAVLYQRGYEYALEDRYQLANDTFFRAWQLRPRDRWFTAYAELYVEKRQYQLAVEKYDELVFGMDEATRGFLRRAVSEGRLIESVPVGPRERRRIFDLLNVNREAILDHGALQSEILASYERADELYSIILFGDEYDYDALLARGDNFMRWADENPERYEDARLAYAGLLARYGDTDEILMRFLRYFVRTDNAERVEELVDLFEEQAPEAEVDPEIYAGAAGYLMDRGRISGIREMLIRSYQRDPLVPEVHYELARYSRIVQAPIQEREALENARQAFTLAEPLSRRRLIQQIDTDIRSGEYWYEREEFLQARGDFDAARRRYETARESGFIPAEAHLARLYARLADLGYFQGGDFEYALDRYDRAA
ncbi:MAG: hypothetical protein MI724_03405, partial [Spirochaetales bacterium]|nr:hypothetical protein [Spirochaetales bacterium]